MLLLSDQKTNAKLSKNADLFQGWNTSILYLAPADVAATGVNLCPASTPGCRAACLFTAGRGAFSNVYQARINKTKRFVFERQAFMADLVSDLEALVKRQEKTGVRQAVRLNGTSDVCWENEAAVRDGVEFQGVPQAFPELLFYDYTKRPSRIIAGVPSNYRLTFSFSETTPPRFLQRMLREKINVAVVFEWLPESFLGVPVIDGTTHDNRFLDPQGVIVGLVAKGKAKKDQSGFVVRT